MNKIHQLSPETIAKIAAGEVIERPSFAVKELIENAIDAKATHIEITIQEAGLQQITVIDNGEGMGKVDLLQSFLLHTTSKITPDDQLTHITHLGFRGEALSTIAAISHLTIQSRPKAQSSGN